MPRVSAIFRPVVGFVICLALNPISARVEASSDNVEVLVSARGAVSCRPPGGRFHAFEKRSEMMVGRIKGRLLSLTGCEVWSVPKDELEAFKVWARGDVDLTVLEKGRYQMFQETDAKTALDREQQVLIEAIEASKATAGVRIMEGPPPAVLEYMLTRDASATIAREATGITVSLGDGGTRTVVRASVEIRADCAVWRGTVQETAGSVTLMWWPSGKMAGTIHSGGRLYSVRHLGGRRYAVVEMNPKNMPEEHAPASNSLRRMDPSVRDDPLVSRGEAGVLRSDAARRRAVADGRPPQPDRVSPLSGAGSGDAVAIQEVVIDVMVVFTRKVKTHYLDVRRELVDLAIEEANNSFRLSNLEHVRLKLVHVQETDYVENGEHFDHLYRMVDPGDGYLEDVPLLRDRHNADVVVLIVDDAKGCGLATRVYADAEEAFAVIHHECAAANYSLAHEIGHLIGARHEIGLDPSIWPFPYGHGYVNGTKWRDIMSSKSSCDGCERLPIWSSPRNVIRGETAGTAAESDNSRVIADEAARVAAFRVPGRKPATTSRPPTLSFPAADK